jgi:predicted DsbA family dithiol-disulfide isomerase
LKRTHGDSLRITWKAFLLRPEPPVEPRTMADFRAYTESWRRPDAEEPSAGFHVWSSEEGPPSHSVPPHRAAKAAARIDRAAGERLHELLLDAYFRHSRDITATEVLQSLWQDAGLDPARFVECEAPEILVEIEDDFREALENGAGGAPAVRLAGGYGVLMGAQPIEVYERWIERALAGATG